LKKKDIYIQGQLMSVQFLYQKCQFHKFLQENF